MKFRMVDRIIAWEPYRAIRGVKTVSFEEYELKERLGDEPSLPESLLMESLFQLGNWLVILSSDFAKWVLWSGWKRCGFWIVRGPGCQLMIETKVRSWRDDGILFDGRATAEGKPITAGSGCLAMPAALMSITIPMICECCFREIYQPTSVTFGQNQPPVYSPGAK